MHASVADIKWNAPHNDNITGAYPWIQHRRYKTDYSGALQRYNNQSGFSRQRRKFILLFAFHSMGEFVYAVTAADGVILSLLFIGCKQR